MNARPAQRLLAGLVTALIVSGTAFARDASTLLDINGARGSSAESMLQDRGFIYITGNKNSMGYTYSYWWHADDRNCVRVEVYDGKVETIADATARDCNQSASADNGSNSGKVAAAVVGAALIGALIASKSHHHDDQDYDETQTADFDRGYQDGLHGASYHNSSRSDAYSHGYEKGVDERNANLSHHSGRGGYAAMAPYEDLNGGRAASADGQLTSRGFTNVDGFKSGSTSYTIWSKRDTHQCLQMTVADGRVQDIRDIGQHPKCR